MKYFKLAVRYADDPKFAKEKRGAMLDLARVYHGAGRLDDAVAAYKEYLAAHPNDVQAMAGLAAAYSRQDKKDEAMTMFAQPPVQWPTPKIISGTPAARPRDRPMAWRRSMA